MAGGQQHGEQSCRHETREEIPAFYEEHVNWKHQASGKISASSHQTDTSYCLDNLDNIAPKCSLILYRMGQLMTMLVSLNTDGHVKSLNGSSDELNGDDAF